MIRCFNLKRESWEKILQITQILVKNWNLQSPDHTHFAHSYTYFGITVLKILLLDWLMATGVIVISLYSQNGVDKTIKDFQLIKKQLSMFMVAATF